MLRIIADTEADKVTETPILTTLVLKVELYVIIGVRRDIIKTKFS
jgi:hypothetical protein